jgi:DNA adenine methylase
MSVAQLRSRARDRVAEPIVKWAGGKQSLADKLVEHFPAHIARYYEPFVGGASVALKASPREGVLGDQNEWLIDVYRSIGSHPRQVCSRLDEMPNTEADYYRFRSIDPVALPPVERAALFIYLNKTCFRGLYRVNKRNRFNVPYGQYDRPYYDLDNVLAFSEFIRRHSLVAGDFASSLSGMTRRDFVYLDPPYYKSGGYSDFNRYTAGQFKESDHLRLRDLCVELDARGIRWAQSNSDTAFIRDLYKGFKSMQISNRREINLKSGNREITELLITNY